MRIGQHANVKHIVGIAGDPALEGEGLEHQRQLGAFHDHHGAHVALQLRGADQAGVDHMRVFAQVGQQLTLHLDGLAQLQLAVGFGFVRVGLRQRVFTP